jgi:hypothetical protein
MAFTCFYCIVFTSVPCVMILIKKRGYAHPRSVLPNQTGQPQATWVSVIAGEQ